MDLYQAPVLACILYFKQLGVWLQKQFKGTNININKEAASST